MHCRSVSYRKENSRRYWLAVGALRSAVIISFLCAISQILAQDQGASDSSRRIPPRVMMPFTEPAPGPGPNRLDHATSESYLFGLGDLVQIFYSFRPTEMVDSQKILPQDQLTISFHFAANSREAYRVQPLDEIGLYFRYSPPASGTSTSAAHLTMPYTVQPDGMITLIGANESVKLKDLTSSEVQRLVSSVYKKSKLLENPDVSVNVTPKFAMEQSLKDALGGAEPLSAIIPDDGRITLPLIPDTKAEGKTVQQLGKELTDRYRELGFKSLTVNARFVLVADERHNQLRDVLKTNSYFSYEINPSGRISLPMYEGFKIVGKSSSHVSRELTEHYRKRGLERVEVTAALESPRSRVFRVLGAVAYPNVYAFRGAADLWGAIAMAGGATEAADLTQVRIIPWQGGKPLGPFNFQDFLKSGDAAHDPLLSGDELIYVPRKGE